VGRMEFGSVWCPSCGRSCSQRPRGRSADIRSDEIHIPPPRRPRKAAGTLAAIVVSNFQIDQQAADGYRRGISAFRPS